MVFANRDTVEHHIKSFSSSKPFEIAVHKPGDTPPPIRFDKEGAIVAYCIPHDWMRAYVYVADTPWTAISGDNGLARIENVAPGDYELTAWHPDLGQFKPPLTSKITVGASGTMQTTVKFDSPRPIRKAPRTADGKVAMTAHHHQRPAAGPVAALLHAARLNAALGQGFQQVVVAEHMADTDHDKVTVRLFEVGIDRFRHRRVAVIKHACVRPDPRLRCRILPAPRARAWAHRLRDTH